MEWRAALTRVAIMVRGLIEPISDEMLDDMHATLGRPRVTIMSEPTPKQIANARKLNNERADVVTIGAALGWHGLTPESLRRRLRDRFGIIPNDTRKRAHNGDATTYYDNRNPDLRTRLPGRLR